MNVIFFKATSIRQVHSPWHNRARWLDVKNKLNKEPTSIRQQPRPKLTFQRSSVSLVAVSSSLGGETRDSGPARGQAAVIGAKPGKEGNTGGKR